MTKIWRTIRMLIATLLLIALALGAAGCLFGRQKPTAVGSVGPWPADDRLLAEHVPGQVVVRLKPGADITSVAKTVGAQPVKEFRRLNAWLLNLPAGQPVGAAANRLATNSGVKYAEPNHIYHTTAFPASGAPSDTYYAMQSGALGQIRATEGWSALDGGGSPGGIAIAVVDTGVDHRHPDFSEAGFPGGWKVLPGYNAIDDLADPVDGSAAWHSDPSSYDETHGTHVAGIAAARANDATGVAGVAWGARILPVKALSSYGGTDFDIAKGIMWASDYDPDPRTNLAGAVKVGVINMSFGGTGYGQVLQDAITYASGKGIVTVAAMGNEYKAEVSYPAAMQGVIAVGAVDQFDHKADFSNPGPHISLAAPGVDIYSDLYLGFQSHSYGRMSGTSMATPFVSGAAALALAKWPSLSATPSLTFAKVKWHLENTARKQSGATYPNRSTGAGTLDLGAALNTPPDGVPGGYGTLVVRVSAGGNAVYLADVTVVSAYPGPSARTIASGRTDVAGEVTFAALPATADSGYTVGNYTVFVSTRDGNSGAVAATVTPGAATTLPVLLGLAGQDSLGVKMSWATLPFPDLYVVEPGLLAAHSEDTVETENGGFGQFAPLPPDQRGLAYVMKTDHSVGAYRFGVGYTGTAQASITVKATRSGVLPVSGADGTQVGEIIVLPRRGVPTANGEPAGAAVVRLEWTSGTANLLVFEPDGTKTGIGTASTSPTGVPNEWESPHGRFTTGGSGSGWIEYRLEDGVPPTALSTNHYRLAVEVQGAPAATTLEITRLADPSLAEGQPATRNYHNLFSIDIAN